MAARATPFISFFASPEMPKAICFQKLLRSVQCTNTQLYLPTTVFDGWNIPVTCELTRQKKNNLRSLMDFNYRLPVLDGEHYFWWKEPNIT